MNSTEDTTLSTIFNQVVKGVVVNTNNKSKKITSPVRIGKVEATKENIFADQEFNEIIVAKDGKTEYEFDLSTPTSQQVLRKLVELAKERLPENDPLLRYFNSLAHQLIQAMNSREKTDKKNEVTYNLASQILNLKRSVMKATPSIYTYREDLQLLLDALRAEGYIYSDSRTKLSNNLSINWLLSLIDKATSDSFIDLERLLRLIQDSFVPVEALWGNHLTIVYNFEEIFKLAKKANCLGDYELQSDSYTLLTDFLDLNGLFDFSNLKPINIKGTKIPSYANEITDIIAKGLAKQNVTNIECDDFYWSNIYDDLMAHYYSEKFSSNPFTFENRDLSDASKFLDFVENINETYVVINFFNAFSSYLLEQDAAMFIDGQFHLGEIYCRLEHISRICLKENLFGLNTLYIEGDIRYTSRNYEGSEPTVPLSFGSLDYIDFQKAKLVLSNLNLAK